MSYEDVLSACGFRDVERRQYEEERAWTVEQLIGYLYSVSTYSKPSLGDRAATFENDIRRTHREVDASGQYAETARFDCRSAKSPSE